MIRFFALAGTVLVIFLSTATSAFCHKMRVFAYSEGDVIMGEAAFAGGRSAMNIEILVEDSGSGKNLLTTKTDDQGNFEFAIPEEAKKGRLNLLIIANAGAGHRAEWPLNADDYLLPAATETTAEKTEPTEKTQGTRESPAVEAATGTSITEERMRIIIEDAVSRELAPLKRYLAENSERKMSFQDILGGIGYIIGLAGLAAYMKSKQKGDPHDQ